MFNLFNNWRLYATLSVERSRTRVLIMGLDGEIPADVKDKTGFALNRGYSIIEISEEVDKKKLIDAGLTSTSPLLVTGFITEPIKEGKKEPTDQKNFDFTNANSFIQSKDGKFESQYCMCENCNHPVTVLVTSTVNQALLDRINSGEIIELPEGIVSYSCGNCGNISRKTYKDLLAWRTLSCGTLCFDEPKKKPKRFTLKIDNHAAGFRDLPDMVEMGEQLEERGVEPHEGEAVDIEGGAAPHPEFDGLLNRVAEGEQRYGWNAMNFGPEEAADEEADRQVQPRERPYRR